MNNEDMLHGLEALQAHSTRLHSELLLTKVRFDHALRRGNRDAQEALVERTVVLRNMTIAISRQMAVIASRATAGGRDCSPELRASIANLQRQAGMRRYNPPEV